MEKVFKSRVSKLFVFSVVFFTAVAFMFIDVYVRKRIPLMLLLGVLFLIVDAVYLLPNIFFTKYTFKEQYLVVREWPFRYTNVFYEDVVSFDDAKKDDRVKKAGMAFDTVVIGYYDDNDDKKFIEVSPRDMQMFMLVLGSRVKNFTDAEKVRTDRIEREKDEKHRRRQKYLENVEQQRVAQEQKVRVIKVSGLVKERGFSTVEED